MHDGAIISWEPGLGKTFAALAWPIIKQARRVLLVVPGGLHKQFQETAIRHFKTSLTTIKTHQDFTAFGLHKSHPSSKSHASTRFFLTTYQDLGMNGADEWPDEITPDGRRKRDPDIERRRKAWCVKNKRPYQREAFKSVGEERAGIRCVWIPTLARLAAACDSFDCVVIDEGTRLQANDSCISLGVRILNPRYRLVLTGTPIKNRLESLFWLAWWAAGGNPEPHARWPYPGTSESREEFANHHLQHDRFVTREETDAAIARMERRRARKFEKRTARLCNVHRLWKLIAPIVIRRRKEDCGEEIMHKIIKPIRIQPGTAQYAVYHHHLKHPPISSKSGNTVNRRSSLGMQLNLLRQAALCPHAKALGESRNDQPKATKRSWTEFNPKTASCLTLIADLLDSGKQVIIGSPFREFSNSLHSLLQQAGVSSLLLDGGTSPEKRGQMAAAFKTAQYAVMIAGINAMGEGHSFECCSHLILPSLSWAYDENEQFTQRVWRINSPEPVTIYPIILQGTIDEKLAQIFSEKGDSAQLALDGRLFADRVEEVNLNSLLAAAMTAYNPHESTLDEQEMENNWPTLRHRLHYGEIRFREFHPPIAAIAGRTTTPGEIQSAMNALAQPSKTRLGAAIEQYLKKGK